MRIKIKSVGFIAYAVSIATLIFMLIVLWFSTLWQPHWVAIAVVMAIAIYHFVSFACTSFVDNRIKPLYQFIGSVTPRKKDRNISKSLALLEGELRLWVERSNDEMNTLRAMENYRKEFLGNVSHELKTPLFSLQGYIETLRNGAVNDKQICERYLERSDKNIERLINIVRDLEEISRLESDTMVLYKTDFDIVSLISESADAMESLFAENDVRLVIMPKISVLVHADRSRIEQVVTNLLSNAVKYNNRGGRVEITIDDMFDSVMIGVIDNGPGIENEHLPRLFERFYRTDKARSRGTGGTGLGLSIVKHIIEAHGQTIKVQSAVGEGSAFLFTLEKAK